MLERFVAAQDGVYEVAFAEIQRGKKRTHWMWYVFPQINGLGTSDVAIRFAIQNREEAIAYLNHPLLGSRLEECCEALLDITNKTATDIFGYPDDVKLRSSMTLFAEVADDPSLFNEVLSKYFGGHKDARTVAILMSM